MSKTWHRFKDDVVFEMELVKQVEVNIDYILMLVAKYHESNCTDKEILGAIDKAIKSSLALRSKKELIKILWKIFWNSIAYKIIYYNTRLISSVFFIAKC